MSSYKDTCIRSVEAQSEKIAEHEKIPMATMKLSTTPQTTKCFVLQFFRYANESPFDSGCFQ